MERGECRECDEPRYIFHAEKEEGGGGVILMRQFDNASRSRPGGKFRDITFHSRGKLQLRFEEDQILINAKDILYIL